MSDPYDVIILGGGNAGLCAAIAALEKGAKVLVLEKAPEYFRGGNTYFTGGIIRCERSQKPKWRPPVLNRARL